MRKTVESIIEAGRLLIEAKAALPHGEFEAMVERDLSFTVRTAEHFMRIARDERITNPKLASLLPPSWYSLSELTRLTDDEFDTALENGSINPEMQRVEVKTLVVGRRSTVEPKLVPIEAVSKFDPTAAKSGDTRGMQQPTTPAEQVRARYIELLRSLDKKTRTAEIFNLMKDVGIAVGGG